MYPSQTNYNNTYINKMASALIQPMSAQLAPLSGMSDAIQAYFKELETPEPYGTQYPPTRKRLKPYNHLGDMPGMVEMLEDIVMSQAQQTPMWPNTSVFMPLEQTDKLSVQATKTIFNPRFPAPISEESVVPYIEHSTETTSAALEPYGQGIRYNMEALRTARGAELYMLSMYELISNFHIHIACAALDAALAVDRNEAEYQRIYMEDRNWINNTVYAVNWFAAAVKSPQGLFELVNRSATKLRSLKHVPTCIAMDASKRSLALFGSDLTYTHQKGGQEVANRLYTGEFISTISGVPVYETPIIQNFDFPYARPSLLNRRIQFGEYYRIMMTDFEQYVNQYGNGQTNFGRAFLSPKLFNEHRDSYEVVPMDKILENVMNNEHWRELLIENNILDNNEQLVENVDERERNVPVRQAAELKRTAAGNVLDFSIMLCKLSRMYEMSTIIVAAGGAGMGITALYPLRIDNYSDSSNRTGGSSLISRFACLIRDYSRIEVNPYATFAHVYRDGSDNKFFTPAQFSDYYMNQAAVGVPPASLLAIPIAQNEPEPELAFIDISGNTGNHGDTTTKHYSTSHIYGKLFKALTSTNGYAFATDGNRVMFRGNMWQVSEKPNNYNVRITGNGHHGMFEYDSCVANVRAEGIHVYNQNAVAHA